MPFFPGQSAPAGPAPHSRHDEVPTSGAWQTDPELRRLEAAVNAARARDIAAGNARSPAMAETLAFKRYVEANRARLGIPDNYWPDPSNNGDSLYDPNQNSVRNTAIRGAAMAAGGYALGSVLPAAGGAASAGISDGVTTFPSAVPAMGGTAGALSGVGPPAAATAGATGSLASRLKGAVPNTPSEAEKFLALIPLLASMGSGSGGNNPFNDPGITDEIKQSMALQRQRLQQTQPVFDTLVNMSYGTSPTRYRGAPPAGYTPNAAPSGPYQYQGPRFS